MPALSGTRAVAALVDALVAVCGPRPLVMASGPDATAGSGVAARAPSVSAAADELVVRLFQTEGRSLVRLVRLFVDDRNAAEDLVQEGFIRLARHADRIREPDKAAAYLRSIVLNLARDHNRRGFVSFRQHLPLDDEVASFEDELMLREEHRAVVEALRDISPRQRDSLVLRYYHEMGIDDIAEALGVSRNSVKTHLQRGMAALEAQLAAQAAGAEDEGETW